MNNDLQDFLTLIKKYHEGQTRNNGRIPYWQHCASVEEILESDLDKTQEITDPVLKKDLLTAALAHDLLEDTSLNREELKKMTNLQVADFVFALTNTESDSDRIRYMEKIGKSSEEVLLIKLADLTENTISCAYGIHDLTKKWVTDFYLPILEDTKKEIIKVKFEKYPKTADILFSQLAFGEERLYHNIEKY